MTDARALIWDVDSAPPASGVILWRAFAGDGARSVPAHLEANGERLRARYLAWVHELGASPAGGGSLCDALALRPGFSAWWMTLVAQKSVFNSPGIVTALKLLALEDMLGAEPGGIVLASPDAALAAALRAWCARCGRAFEWRRQPGGARVSFTRRAWGWLPAPLQAGGALLRHWLRRRAFASARLPAGPAPVTLITYLFNFGRAAAADGRLESNYWGALPGLLARRGRMFRWLLQYFEHPELPAARDAAGFVRRLNSGGQPALAFDAELGAGAVAGALRDYARLALRSFGLPGLQARFTPRDSSLDFWPLFAADWRSSLRGVTAMDNCLALNVMERALRRLPRQAFGLYPQENIAWELALVHAWRAAGHGPLVGVPHSTVRFWDLRYFGDPRSHAREGRNPQPQPDRIAVNGPAALQEFLAAGHPAERLVAVEALRFAHLEACPEPRAAPVPGSPLRVLALTDYMPRAASLQVGWLAAVQSRLPAGSSIVIKAHPACPVSLADFPGLDATLAREPIEALLAACDVAFVSNTTSAGVDALSSGVPVVVLLDGESFNFSPLRGMAGVEFVGTAEGLAPALERAARSNTGRRTDFFFLDRELPRWQRFIDGLEIFKPAM